MGGRGARPDEASQQEAWLDGDAESDNAQVRAGAGGRWRTIGEVVDPSVVQQYNPVACGAACGEMVLQDRGVSVDQTVVSSEAGGVPMDAAALAGALNTLDTSGGGTWQGGMIDISGAPRAGLVGALNQTGSWVAVMWETGASIGHTVIVDGLDEAGYVRVRDPWDSTRYTMTIRSFLAYWTGVAVTRR